MAHYPCSSSLADPTCQHCLPPPRGDCSCGWRRQSHCPGTPACAGSRKCCACPANSLSDRAIESARSWRPLQFSFPPAPAYNRTSYCTALDPPKKTSQKLEQWRVIRIIRSDPKLISDLCRSEINVLAVSFRFYQQFHMCRIY